MMQYVFELFAAVQNWLKQSGLIPLSAIVAVVLFVTREILGSRRKKRAKTIEVIALKRILARECELNWYLSNQITDICNIYGSDWENDGYETYFLELTKTPSNKIWFEILNYRGEKGKGILSESHITTFHNYLYEMVKTDIDLYEKLEPAYEAAIVLKSLRDSLIDKPGEWTYEDDTDMMLGFSEHASGEIENINNQLKILYQFCTGKELSQGRMR